MFVSCQMVADLTLSTKINGAIDDTALERVTGGAGIDWISVAQGQIYGG